MYSYLRCLKLRLSTLTGSEFNPVLTLRIDIRRIADSLGGLGVYRKQGHTIQLLLRPLYSCKFFQNRWCYSQCVDPGEHNQLIDAQCHTGFYPCGQRVLAIELLCLHTNTKDWVAVLVSAKKLEIHPTPADISHSPLVSLGFEFMHKR
jgi:hypothetical protein